jgi:hypothetical protein
MLLFRSSVLHLMLPQFYERVDRWTHETVTILITRNTFPTLCMCLFIFSYFLKWKNKNIFHFLQSYQKHKTSLFTALVHFLHLLSVILFIYCTYSKTLCLTTIWWSWGRKTRSLFCMLPHGNEESFFNYSLGVRYLPRVIRVGKITLATTLCTWSLNEKWHIA